jgi:hypothetical protein
MARAPVSKTGGWGFESLHSCQFILLTRRIGAPRSARDLAPPVQRPAGLLPWDWRREMHRAVAEQGACKSDPGREDEFPNHAPTRTLPKRRAECCTSQLSRRGQRGCSAGWEG